MDSSPVEQFDEFKVTANKAMEIETKRLILREFRMDDWPAVFAYQSDAR
jgi:hypothetical protein